MEELIKILQEQNCSLVVNNHGVTRVFGKPGVRDLEDLLDHEPEFLKGATVADKVVGKAAAGMMAFGGVKMVYGEVMSTHATPLLETNNINYTFGKLVDHIEECGDRCQLERITAKAQTAEEVVTLLRAHFAEMQAKRNH